MSYDRALFGICNPLLDISANVSLDLVTKYGAAFGSAIMADDKQQPVYDEIVKNYDVEYTAGGATQNVFRVYQWLMQTSTPAATFLGCVGNDEYGKTLKKNAEKDGLHIEYQVDEKAPTGTCAVLVVGKERSLIANLGAANNYSKEHFHSEKVQELFKKANFYYFSGFFVTVQPEVMVEVGKHAAETNKIYSLNLSAPFVIQFFKDQLTAALPYTDYLFGNEDEAKVFAASNGWETSDVAEIAAKASLLEKANDKRKRTVVFTQGPHSVCVGYDGKVEQYPVQKIDSDLIVDTNGAGDSFCGGFLAGLVQGKDIKECVRAAIYTSSTVIQHSGCTFPEKPDFKFN
ncbi:adenosine kinase [Acrasis kona]|uniref:Adenosine kinase n=1 Tax=Acrasis kona TaxID=1008807 RepID=A0AAW2YZU8_9EUKA